MTTQLVNSDGTPFEAGFEPLLTPREAAGILAVNTRTLSMYADKGRIRFTRTEGGHRRYPADAVRAASRGRWDLAGDPNRSVDDVSPADVVVSAA